MPDAEVKTRMISLRVSEEEYQFLKKNCRMYGTRNLSDFTRLAVQRVMTGSAGWPCDLGAKLAELEQRLRSLESRDVARSPQGPSVVAPAPLSGSERHPD
jgi:hypothetical protein